MIFENDIKTETSVKMWSKLEARFLRNQTHCNITELLGDIFLRTVLPLHKQWNSGCAVGKLLFLIAFGQFSL